MDYFVLVVHDNVALSHGHGIGRRQLIRWTESDERETDIGTLSPRSTYLVYRWISH